MRTFAEQFCERYQVSPENFVSAMFWHCLYRRAWIFVPVFRLFSRSYFTPDYELIRAIGRLRSTSEFGDELIHFYTRPGGNGFVRRRLKVRLSARRVSHLVYELLPNAARQRAHGHGGTRPPVVTPKLAGTSAAFSDARPVL